MAKEVPQLVKVSLRAVLLSQKGIKQTDVAKDYKKLSDSQLDVKKYGFQDLYEFLLAIPDVARLEYSPKDGENKVFGVAEKGVYISDHAKKNMGVPNGFKPVHPSQWPRNVNKRERTVVAPEPESKKKIVPNSLGLYGLHIKNLPPNCQQSDINCIFKNFKSLTEVKIEGFLNRVAFVRFSARADAIKALCDMDGFNFQGFSLIINPAIERNDKTSKDVKERSKKDSAKKKANSAAAKNVVNKKESSSGQGHAVMNKSPLKNELQSVHVAASENWEKDCGLLLPKSDAAKTNKFFSQENLAAHISKMDGGYPILVSNFPPGTSQSTLKQIFSGCGEIVRIEVHEKFAFIYFAKEEDAMNALQTMQKRVPLCNKILTVSPRISKEKATRQLNLPVGGVPTLSRGSSQSSVSSCDPQSPESHSISEAGFQLGDNNLGLTPTGILCNAKTVVNEDRTSDGSDAGDKQRTCSSVSNVTSGLGLHKEKERQFARRELKAVGEDECASIKTEPSKQGVPVHTLLSYEEMCKLMQRCCKSLKTVSRIALDEFEVLVTEVIDSCHFWAIVDDKCGSYKELQQIKADLQIVEHHRTCMPVKYQLGAARYSEDNKWYRCWCLEVSSIARKEVKVFYLDYGNCEWIPWDQFTDIHKRFWDLAPQAVPFKLAGLGLASNLRPDIINEGTKCLRSLICDKVCRARKIKQPEPTQAYVTEVELFRKEDNMFVNNQMALTRYVQGRKVTPNLKRLQELNSPSSCQTPVTLPTLQPKSHHIPPHPFMSPPAQDPHWSTQVPHSGAQTTHSAAQGFYSAAQDTQSAAKMTNTTTCRTHQSESHDILLRKESSASALFESKIAQVTKSPFPSPQGTQGESDQQQQQQLLPNQLFVKSEILDVFLSYVDSPDDVSFFLADDKTKLSRQKIHHLLKDCVDPSGAGKIFPQKGDVVVKLCVKGTRYRVKITSIPTSSAYGIDKVVVKDIDYGRTETVSLSTLCELPPSLKDIPAQEKRAKLAGLRRKKGAKVYPKEAVNYLLKVKTKRQVMQASVIRRDLDGILYVELFESGSIPSVNVQLVKLGYAELDPSQCSLLASRVTSPKPEDCRSSENLRTSDLPTTGMTDRFKDIHHCDTRSVHSDWEESLVEAEEDWDDITPPTRIHMETQSSDQLYLPPPPDVSLPSPPVATRLDSSTLTVEPPSSPMGFSNSLHSFAGPSLLKVRNTNEPSDVLYPYSEKDVNSGSLDVTACYKEELENRAPSEVRPSSPATGSDSSGVYSDTSLNSLSGAETIQNKQEKSLLGNVIPQQTLEANSTDQDWRLEREELIQKESELRRILEMPRQEVKKMINLKQEKERLERKIRVKKLENEILKLQRELKQLEFEKGELKKETDQ